MQLVTESLEDACAESSPGRERMVWVRFLKDLTEFRLLGSTLGMWVRVRVRDVRNVGANSEKGGLARAADCIHYLLVTECYVPPNSYIEL